MPRINALFVCSRNQWRSPTAARVFRNDQRLSVRSCGLSPSCLRQLRADDVLWADVVFVMENRHGAHIRSQFRDALGETPHYVLGIPDGYQFMSPKLVELLRDRVEGHLRELQSG